jgi:hypothetical protein
VILTPLDGDGNVVDLTGALARFHLGNADDELLNAPAEIIDAGPTNRLRFLWPAGTDLYRGSFDAEFEVTYPDGGIETFPNSRHLSIVFLADPGAATPPQPLARWTLEENELGVAADVLGEHDGEWLELGAKIARRNELGMARANANRIRVADASFLDGLDQELAVAWWWFPRSEDHDLGGYGMILGRPGTYDAVVDQFVVTSYSDPVPAAGEAYTDVEVWIGSDALYSTDLSDLAGFYDSWHHVVVSVDLADDGRSRIYVDGVDRTLSGFALDAVDTIPSGPADAPLHLGRMVLADGVTPEPPGTLRSGSIDGIDNVEIYDRALSAAEALELYRRESL